MYKLKESVVDVYGRLIVIVLEKRTRLLKILSNTSKNLGTREK